MAKTKVVIEIDVPEGATHYAGWLTSGPAWFKQKPVAGHPVWFQWHEARQEWVLSGEHKPHWAMPLVDVLA